MKGWSNYETMKKETGLQDTPSMKNFTDVLSGVEEEVSDEKLNRAYRLREEIEHRIQDLETRKSTLLLQAMKASLQDCINEAKTDDERADYIDMMSRFEFLHPGI